MKRSPPPAAASPDAAVRHANRALHAIVARIQGRTLGAAFEGFRTTTETRLDVLRYAQDALAVLARAVPPEEPKP